MCTPRSAKPSCLPTRQLYPSIIGEEGVRGVFIELFKTGGEDGIAPLFTSKILNVRKSK